MWNEENHDGRLLAKKSRKKMLRELDIKTTVKYDKYQYL